MQFQPNQNATRKTGIVMAKKYYIIIGIFFLAVLALGLWHGEVMTVYNKAIVI